MLQRVRVFYKFLSDTNSDIFTVDFGEYVSFLRENYSPSSAQSHLATIRGAYLRMLSGNEVRDYLASMSPYSTMLETKAFIDELITRMKNGLYSKDTSIKVIKTQDDVREVRYRMTIDEVNQLLGRIDEETLTGLRDKLIIFTLVVSGLRVFELIALKVEDVLLANNGKVSIRVRSGKGMKQRIVPLGAFSNRFLELFTRWINEVNLTETDFIFLRVRKNDIIERKALSDGGVAYILRKYPLYHKNILTNKWHCTYLSPHDYRATYARLLYEHGVPIDAIQLNMGHSDQKTTRGYIGILNDEHRSVKIDFLQNSGDSVDGNSSDIPH